MSMTIPYPDPATVGEVRENLTTLVERDVEGRANEWRIKRLAQLLDYDDAFPLLTLTEVAFKAAKDQRVVMSEVERHAIIWQHRRHIALGDFEQHLWDAIGEADEDNLDRLALGYPVHVEAVRQWRSGKGFAARLRELPSAFTL